MSTDAYHTTIDPISRSQLSAFYEDPEQFKAVYIEKTVAPPKAGAAAELGKAFHAWLLLEKPLTDLVREIPEHCLNTRGGIVRARLDDYRAGLDESILWLKSEQYESTMLVLDSARRCIENDIGGRQEREIDLTASIEGVRCKMRADVLQFGTANAPPALHDFKFSANISDRDFRRSARDYRYWLQDAHYSTIVADRFKVNDSLRVPFYFWTVETKAPYRVWYRVLNDFDRRAAHQKHREILIGYREALESGEFESRRSHEFGISDWELEMDLAEGSSWEAWP